MALACMFLKDLASAVSLTSQIHQLDWWQEPLGWKCHDAERVSQ